MAAQELRDTIGPVFTSRDSPDPNAILDWSLQWQWGTQGDHGILVSNNPGHLLHWVVSRFDGLKTPTTLLSPFNETVLWYDDLLDVARTHPALCPSCTHNRHVVGWWQAIAMGMLPEREGWKTRPWITMDPSPGKPFWQHTPFHRWEDFPLQSRDTTENHPGSIKAPRLGRFTPAT